MFRLSADEIHAHVDFLRSVSRVVEPHTGLPVVLLDPNDDAVPYTAVAASADICAFKDRHFFDPHVVAFCAREDIRVMDELALPELPG
jgi:hypothetical protein